MKHELVFILEPIPFDSNNRAVVGNAEEKIPTFGVEECRDGLERGMGHPLSVLAFFLEVPAEHGLELQGYGLALPDQLSVVVLRPPPAVAARPHIRIAVGRGRLGAGTRNSRELMEAALGGRQGRRPSYVRKADGEFEARLVALSCAEPPEGHSQWSLRLLADRVVELGHIDSVSHETVRRVLKKTQSSRGGASAG